MKYKLTPSKFLGFAILCAVIVWWLFSGEPNLDPFGRERTRHFVISLDPVNPDTGEAVKDCKLHLSPAGRGFDDDINIPPQQPFHLLYPVADDYTIFLDTDSGLSVPMGSFQARSINQDDTDAVKHISIDVKEANEWINPAREDDGSAVLHARAVDEHGNPVAATQVVVHGKFFNGNSRVLKGFPVDADGRFFKRYETTSSEEFYLKFGNLRSPLTTPNHWVGTEEAPADIVLRPAAELHGTVLRSDGSAGSDLLVVATTITGWPRWERCTLTDAQGKYRIDGLWPGEYTIHLLSPNTTELIGLFDSLEDIIRNMDDKLGEQSKLLVGLAMRHIGPLYSSFKGIPPEVDRLPVKADEVMEQLSEYSNAENEVSQVTLRAGERREFKIHGPQFDAQLYGATGTLDGIVSGQPGLLQRATIYVYYDQQGRTRTRKTNTTVNGEFRFEGLPEATPLRVFAVGGGYVVHLDDLRADGRYIKLELMPEPRIGVELRDEVTGLPLDDVYLGTSDKELLPEHTYTSFYEDGYIKQGELDIHREIAWDGRFVLTGQYYYERIYSLDETIWVVAAKKGYAVAHCPVKMPGVGGESVRVALSMRPVPITIGTVCDNSALPILGAKLLNVIDCQNSPVHFASDAPFAPRTGKDGRFELDHSYSSSTHFIAIHPDYAPAIYAIPPKGEEAKCVLEVGHTLSGKVSIDGKHHRVGEVRAICVDDSPLKGIVCKGKTDIDGNFTLEHLAAGRYEISVTYPDDGIEMPVHREEIIVPIADAMLLDIQFDSTTGVWHSKMQSAPVPAAV